MKVSPELRPVRDCLREISRCEAVKLMNLYEVQRLEIEKTSVKAVRYDAVCGQHSMTTPATEVTLIRTEDEKQRCLDAISYAEKRRAKIVGYIMMMKNPLHVKLLSRHYINGERMSDIAESMGYSKNRINRLHVSALKEFRQVLRVVCG